MGYPKVCLHRGEEKGLKAGQNWIYDNEVAWVDEDYTDGGIVDVVDPSEQFLARGFFNSRSKILVRVLTRKEEPIDRDFFARRIRAAWEYRHNIGFSDSCRVVFGESDGLPGLTVDKFGDYLSFQCVSLGMEQWMDDVTGILVDLFHPKGIYARNDVPVREKEGLEQYTRCVYGHVPPMIEILEHEVRMLVDIPGGQKTGHFLDQQENRGRIKPYCKDARVLDLCSHTGGFSIHAALYGAKSVEPVDVSQPALDMLMENAKLNGVEGTIHPTCANVFDVAKDYSDRGAQFDLVICDPPAFAKSRKAVDAAYRGYKELNLRCMKMVAPGGYLVSCSCSQFMTPELFVQMLKEAAADCGRPVRLIETLMQSRDHPALLTSDASWYLKGYMMQLP